MMYTLGNISLAKRILHHAGTLLEVCPLVPLSCLCYYIDVVVILDNQLVLILTS